jgi:hypothetical protein
MYVYIRSHILFSVPQVENEVAEIQEAVTNELKKFKKGVFGRFSESVGPRKHRYLSQRRKF